MKTWAVLLLSTMMVACATGPVQPRNESLFTDELFLAPSEQFGAREIFAVSPQMKQYLGVEIAGQIRAHGRQRGLIDALYTKRQLQLDFDSVITRTASDAFEARTGNCLSLVIMTAALAKELGLSVRFQKVYIDETWSRSGDNYLFIEHVNLTLSERSPQPGFGHIEIDRMMIDFLPPQDIRGARMREIGEDTVVAMFMNNRAVEALTREQLDDAYWWVRAALRQDPSFHTAYNTLGAIYRRHGNLALAEQAFSYALASDPANPRVMSNLVAVLNDEGRVAEAAELNRKLVEIEPNPPFSYFKLGQIAMRAGDYQAARDLFAKEVARAPYYHEFHFWLAAASVNLGDFAEARKHLAIAVENSSTRRDHDLYAAKLDRLVSSGLQ